MTDTEDRLGRLENAIGDIQGSLGEIKGLLKSIGATAHTPGACPVVVSLNLAAARQQGALAVIGVVCGVLGGSIVWALGWLVGR